MDFHCHLDLYPNAKSVYEEAAKRNEFTWLVTTSPRAFEANTRVLKAHSSVLISPGLHPEIAHERAEEIGLLLEQINFTKGVGEIGLDGSPRFKKHFEIQTQIFAAVVARSAELGGRVLSIHSRRAVVEVLSELRRKPNFGIAVLHWFSGNLRDLNAAQKQGCWFSVGPAMFSSANGRSLVAAMPRDRVLPESDGPFAKVNDQIVMPWCAAQTSMLLAQAWRVPIEDATETLEQNGRRFLRVAGF